MAFNTEKLISLRMSKTQIMKNKFIILLIAILISLTISNSLADTNYNYTQVKIYKVLLI